MKRLRDDKTGRLMVQKCPECGAELQVENDELICTGLIDPENVNAPLQACTYSTFNGAHVAI